MVAGSTEVGRTASRHNRRAPARIDMRLVVGRRLKVLTAAFRDRLRVGADPDPLLLTAIERAATLQVLAEDAAQRALRADPKVALDDVVRLARLSDLATARLRLDRKAPEAPTPSVAEYIDHLNGNASGPAPAASRIDETPSPVSGQPLGQTRTSEAPT
jgi:hypothetical protein